MKTTTTSGVLVSAVRAGVAIGFVATLISYFTAGRVLEFLISTYGAVALLAYHVIAVLQLRMRRQLIASGRKLDFKM